MNNENRLSGLTKIFIETDRLHRSVMEKKMAGLDCSPSQHRLLMHLKFKQHPVNQKELAEELKVSTAAVTNTIKKLESSGYIERVKSSVDGRNNDVTITEKGINVLEKTKKIFDNTNNEMFMNISDEEIEYAEKLFEKIYESLLKINEKENNIK